MGEADKTVYAEDENVLYSSRTASEDGTGQDHSPLKRELKSRHITMISVGGVIGQGLFLSSGGALAAAGPAGMLIAYVIIGFIVFWVTFALGECLHVWIRHIPDEEPV